MSWRSAPLYTKAHALACFVGERAQAAERTPFRTAELAPLQRDADELVCTIALALTFPAPRPRHVALADALVVRLRARLALARDLRQVSPGWARAASSQVDEIGRMLGGWQKALVRRTAATIRTRRRAKAAASASCAAAATGTTPPTAVPPTATGTSPTGPTTTTASASSCPPPNPPSEAP